MSGKKSNSSGGLVYSTHPDATSRHEEEQDERETPPPAKQDLRVLIDRKLKGGKAATIVYQFVGRDEDLEALARQLKQSCSVGGSVKNREIILQGDCRDRVCALLEKWGYRYKKAGG